MFLQNCDPSERSTPDNEIVYYEVPLKGHRYETIISKEFCSLRRSQEDSQLLDKSPPPQLSTSTITENMVLTYKRALPTKMEEAFVKEFLEILTEVCKELGIGPSQLSGSWRRGTADCYSDIDFKVEVDSVIGTPDSVVERASQLLKNILRERSKIGSFTKIVDVINCAVPLVVLKAHGTDIDRIIDLAFVSFISPLDAVKSRDPVEKMAIIYIKQLAKERGIVKRGPWIKIPSTVMEEIVVLAVNHWRLKQEVVKCEEDHLGDILLHFCQLFCSEQSIQFGLSRWEVQQLRFNFREVTRMLCDLAHSTLQIIQPHAPVLDLRCSGNSSKESVPPINSYEADDDEQSTITVESEAVKDFESSIPFFLEREDLNTPSYGSINESSPLGILPSLNTTNFVSADDETLCG